MHLIGPRGGEHLVDDPTEMPAERANRLIIRLALLAFLLVIALRLRDLLTMSIDRDHHCGLGARVDLLRRLPPVSE